MPMKILSLRFVLMWRQLGWRKTMQYSALRYECYFVLMQLVFFSSNISTETRQIQDGRGTGHSTKLCTWRLCHQIEPLTPLHILGRERNPFLVPTWELCIPFLNPWSEDENNITATYQALPEETLANSVLFILNLRSRCT